LGVQAASLRRTRSSGGVKGDTENRVDREFEAWETNSPSVDRKQSVDGVGKKVERLKKRLTAEAKEIEFALR
jgi:hypothetical protein